MATSPLLAVLMLGRLGFAPWQYGLAFGAPCVGGLIGSRLAGRLVARFGQHKVMLTAEGTPISMATVTRHLQANGLNRLRHLDPVTGEPNRQPRPGKITADRPGHRSTST
jgi:hypothetical protein